MKLTVAGRGMTGLLSAAHFNKWTDWEIEVVGDPEIPPVNVGEGSTVLLPVALGEHLDFGYDDFNDVGGTQKHGINYEGWYSNSFFHSFPIGVFGLHFDASSMKAWIENSLKSDVTFKDKHIDDIEQVDGDYVMDCRGWAYEDNRTEIEAPINSAVVLEREPKEFRTTLAKAMKHGWMFGIPLQHRTSYGYLYNDQFVSEEEAVEEMLQIVGGEPNYRAMSIPSYHTGFQEGGRIIRNGNASHFFEPLEATSLGCADRINRYAFDHWYRRSQGENVMEAVLFKHFYQDLLIETEAIINMHYLRGSEHDTDFWKYAKRLAEETMSNLPILLLQELRTIAQGDGYMVGNYAEDVISLWPVRAVEQNFDAIGITVDEIERWIEKTPNR